MYIPILEKEVRSYGLNVEISTKQKTKDSTIKSAFLKRNTKEHLLLFYPNMPITGVSNDERIKIKFEVDINPPKFATYEHQYRLLPPPYEIVLYDSSSLFAGKIHAVICRGGKSRIKGRDLYDLVFYLSRKIPVNLKHLRERFVQSEFIESDDECTLQDVKEMLYKRFDEIDYEQAKMDIEPFIRDTSCDGEMKNGF